MRAERGSVWAALAVASLAAAPGSARAQDEPLSAIDWLSDSMAAPEDAAALEPDVTGSAKPAPVAVTPLPASPADAAGLLPPSATGLPRALWGTATVADVAAAIAAVPDDLLPSLRELFLTLLLAEAVPPAGADGERLFLARVDRLLAMGALDQAEALLLRAGAETPERFRRALDIALLKGTETLACRRMKALPEISPTYPARIFCLARNGDWPAAAVTLETAETLGILTEQEDALLARFLDPEIDMDIEASRHAPTPLTFRMMEAIGEPLPTGSLPLAFAWADLRHTRGWKAQIEAAERLARNGAVPAATLFGLYLRQAPSASGGVWDRAAAVHRLQDALNSGDAAAVAQAVPEAWELLRGARLHHVFAEQYGAELARLPLAGAAGDLALRIGLASPDSAAVAAVSGAEPRGDSFLLALARGRPDTAPATDPVALAIRDGFNAPEQPDAYRTLLGQGRTGEAILKAITQFSEGAAGDPDGIAAAIALLRSAGLQKVARRAAVDLLMQEAET